MFKHTFLTLIISSSLLGVSQPSYAAVISHEIIFTPDNQVFPKGNGIFTFDDSNNWEFEGEAAFQLTSFNFTSPLGTNYSLSNIIDEGVYALSFPVFRPLSQTFVFLNFDYVENEDEEYELEFAVSTVFWLQKPGGAIFLEGILFLTNEYIESSIDDIGDYLNNTGSYTIVPEPLTLLGIGTAMSFGAFFKRKLSQK